MEGKRNPALMMDDRQLKTINSHNFSIPEVAKPDEEVKRIPNSHLMTSLNAMRQTRFNILATLPNIPSHLIDILFNS